MSSSSPPAPKDKVIYIVRHGEKIDGKGYQCLSDATNKDPDDVTYGWNRANKLVDVFGSGATEFRTPEALFSTNYANPVDCRDDQGRYRTQQTCSPLAESLNLPIDNRTGYMPQLCGMVMDCSSISSDDPKMDTFMSKKVYKYPEVPPEPTEAWLRSVSNCAGEDSRECHPDGTCTAGALQPGVGAGGVGARWGVGGTCKPYGWGSAPDPDGLAGTCCNSVAAAVMKAKLLEVDTILACWEHINIQWLAYELGAAYSDVIDQSGEQDECWPGESFDIVYALHFFADGTFSKFEKTYQPPIDEAAARRRRLCTTAED